MNWIKLVVAIAVSELAGVVGAIFTAPAISTWYLSLKKPSFSPPNFLFAPVWTILFLLMGIAAYLVWVKNGSSSRIRLALGIFLVQLVLNVLWSYLFFGLQNPAVALGDIILLWLAILATIIGFFPLSRLAAYLLLPYLFWVSFAAVLNFSIVRLNP